MRLDDQLVKACVAALAIMNVTACSGADDLAASDESTSEVSHALVARPAPRLFLSQNVVARLKQRAAAGDAAWTALKQRCDGYVTGKMHAPNGTDYPGFPNVGEGYQGDEYMPAVRALGLCYRTVEGVDAGMAASYGAAGSRLLEAMSTPVDQGGLPPSTNSGYGIRHYGVGMAIGFDWLYPALSAALRERLIRSLNTWVDWYDTSGFLKDDPIGNYFTGYLLAKTTTALATEGDNPKAAAYWEDVQNRLWADLVKPQFSSFMQGGGWPEGWGYGKKAVLSVAETMWAAKTAKNLNWFGELPQLADQAKYLNYFAWPSLEHMDDQGTIRSGTELRVSSELIAGLAMMMEQSGVAYSKLARSFASDVVATAGDDSQPWAKFLYGDSGAAQSTYTEQALSYFAAGPDHVAVRSSWDKTAVWGALSGGAYINAPDSGEQLYNSGSVSVVAGDQPIVINATGWLPQNAGTAGEKLVYADNYETRERRLYNTFFVEDDSNPYSPGQNNFSPADSKAHVERFEEGGKFVHARAVGLEDQYGWHNGSRPVTQFTRELVYVRPGTFVLFDRTTVASAGADQWISLHTAAAPTAVSVSDPTQRRFDVPGGSIRTLLPRSATMKTAALPGGAARIETHAPQAGAAQQWLTVISAGSSGEQTRLSAADGNVSAGDVVGVHLTGPREQVVTFAADHAGTAALTHVEYSVAQAAPADHIVTGLDATSSYAVTTTNAGGKLRVSIARGGDQKPSAQGSLCFSVDPAGAVVAQPPPPPSQGSDGGSTPTDPGGVHDAPSGGTLLEDTAARFLERGHMSPSPEIAQ